MSCQFCSGYKFYLLFKTIVCLNLYLFASDAKIGKREEVVIKLCRKKKKSYSHFLKNCVFTRWTETMQYSKSRLTPVCPQLDAVSFQYPFVIRKIKKNSATVRNGNFVTIERFLSGQQLDTFQNTQQ